MKVKVISDGSIGGTKVVNLETGEEIDNIVELTIHCCAIGPNVTVGPRVTLVLEPVEIEVVGEAGEEVVRRFRGVPNRGI